MNIKRCIAASMAAFLLLTGCGTSELIMEDPLEISETVEATENSESCENVEKTAIKEDSVLEDIEEVNEVPHPDIEIKNEPEIIEEAQEEPEPEIVEEMQNPEQPQEVKTLYGACTITHYCNCSQCCGQWAGGPTASGTIPEAGVTVAADLPFGTEIEINGERYTVQDRGVSGMWIDVYCSSHDEALARGMYTADVYIIAYE